MGSVAGRLTAVAGVCALAILTVVFFWGQSRASASSAAPQGNVSTVVVRRANFRNVLRLSGTTAALRSQPIVAPQLAGSAVGAMVITRIARGGTRVRSGDVLVEFDRQQQYKDFLDKQAQYYDLADQVQEKQAAEQAARAEDQTSLKVAEDALQIAQLEVKKNEILSRIDAEINDEKLAEAKATLAQLRHTYALKRQAAAAGILVLQIKADRAHQAMLYAEANEKKMLIRSPMDGIVVLNEIWLNGRMGHAQEGTQVQPGVPFMRVVDPSKMDVHAEINQADLPYLHVGQAVVVRLDAYPGLWFPGTLEEVSPLGHTGMFSDRVRDFRGVFSISGNNRKLMPDLSAAVDVELASEKNALVVPVESVASGGGASYAWVKSGGGFEKRQITTGPENDLDIVVESGLRAGDVIRKVAPGTGTE
jgi:multidrug efflux pump subunit AcrA (membrane-fusion protein)